VRVSHEPFVRACRGGPIAVVMLDEGEGVDEARWLDSLLEAGATTLTAVIIGEDEPPEPGALLGFAGVFVSGGLTPLYRELLVELYPDWIPEGLDDGAVYGGFSGGAAIAAQRALVGGWQVERGDLQVQVCPEEASEDLELVTVLRGLGVVPFTVDVHASQWGTLPRLLHAVARGEVPDGVAIDEHTCVEVRDSGELVVHGLGTAYRVASGGAVTLLAGH
jgi:cyanophycinase